MSKYLTIFKISFQQEFVYKLNFVMWRVRNLMQIFLIFFLWDSIYSDPGVEIFGYDRTRILTYVFGILIVKSFVLSTRARDVAGDIGRGDLTNYLLKPVNYFLYWLTRDVSSKVLNLIFAGIEFSLLYILLKPPFYLQTNLIYLLGFLVAVTLAMLIFFLIVFIVNFVPFWYPELAWGAQFAIVVILTDFLSGGLFPLDILPSSVLNFINYTPFPYLIFFPIKVYLGQVSGLMLIRGLGISFVWVMVLWILMRKIWKIGLVSYRAEGR